MYFERKKWVIQFQNNKNFINYAISGHLKMFFLNDNMSCFIGMKLLQMEDIENKKKSFLFGVKGQGYSNLKIKNIMLNMVFWMVT